MRLPRRTLLPSKLRRRDTEIDATISRESLEPRRQRHQVNQDSPRPSVLLGRVFGERPESVVVNSGQEHGVEYYQQCRFG